MTTVLEQKVREAADAIIDAANQFNARLRKVEALAEELKHVRDQLKLTYEAIDKILDAMKVDDDKHDKEHAHAEATER